MFISECNIRVRYSETDQMGYVYYGNYAQYFEVARTEALRQVDLTYKMFEDAGTMMPVLSLSCKFKKPAKYDDLLTIKTIIRVLPSVKMAFEYEVYNAGGELLNEGETVLVFINMKNNRPTACPPNLLEKLKPFFEQ